MKTYKILKLEGKLEYVVLSTSYISPLGRLNEVEAYLSKVGYVGEVLFDLLMSNGFASNRILKMDFDGKKFNRNLVTIVENLEADILKILYTFYFENPKYIDNSILPEAQKFILKRNLLTFELGD